MFLILWDLLGGILPISILLMFISSMRESKSEQVKRPIDSRKSSYEEQRYL